MSWFSLFYDIPDGLLYFVCLFGILLLSLAAAGLAQLLRNWHPPLGNSAIVTTLLGGLLVPTGMVLAAVANDVWRADQRGHEAVAQEAVALSNLMHEAVRSNSDNGRAVIDSARAYARSALEREWPMMNHGNASVETTIALDALEDTVALHNESSAPLGRARGAMMQRYLDQIDVARDARLTVARYKVDGTKWWTLFTLLAVGAFVVAELHRNHRRDEIVSLALYSVAFGSLVFLILVFDRPFTGRTIIEPTQLRALLAQPMSLPAADPRGADPQLGRGGTANESRP